MTDRHRLPDYVQRAGIAALEREGRVALIAEAAQLLIKSGTKAGLFTGGGLLAWLENGGDLARDFFMVVRPQSHRTAAAIWRELQAHHDEREDTEEGKE
jgi:hypothetical protein